MLQRIGNLFHDLVPAVLTPAEIVRLNRTHFENPRYFSQLEELSPREQAAIPRLPQGEVLCLGCGAGREALALAKLGFRVFGVDHSRGQIERAQQRAAALGVSAEFEVMDVTRLSANGRRFDGAVLFTRFYGLVATRAARVRLLKNVREMLRPGGVCLLDVPLTTPAYRPRRAFPLFRLTALMVGGNTGVQPGDRMIGEQFFHFFNGPEEIEAEARDAGFAAIEILSVTGPVGMFLLQK
jgi:SAM-dependent methyltransferase